MNTGDWTLVMILVGAAKGTFIASLQAVMIFFILNMHRYYSMFATRYKWANSSKISEHWMTGSNVPDNILWLSFSFDFLSILTKNHFGCFQTFNSTFRSKAPKVGGLQAQKLVCINMTLQSCVHFSFSTYIKKDFRHTHLKKREFVFKHQIKTFHRDKSQD